MKKMFIIPAVLTLLAGCSGHTTSMQDVRSYCRSVTTEVECDGQDSICAEYSEVTLRSYASVKECRQSCEQVRQNSAKQFSLQTCQALYQAVEGKCNEFCDDNYK
ncbi:hypothetical protein [Maridesulfovibrio sp. FT414]|uniref:hypothetical protein n=1 Tax=Maridesulfovibrio sp. FT414 TaxID=2979469 RepID=UPI003D803EB8